MYACAGYRTSDLLHSSVPYNHSAVGAVNGMLLKHLQYFFTRRYYKNYVLCARDI